MPPRPDSHAALLPPGRDPGPVGAPRAPHDAVPRTLRYTYDERVEDGFYAARALERLQALLEEPERLIGIR